jgi:hypothetical protein
MQIFFCIFSFDKCLATFQKFGQIVFQSSGHPGTDVMKHFTAVNYECS